MKIFRNLVTLAAAGAAAAASHLTLTALLSSDEGRAYFECWQIDSPFNDYPTVGSAVVGFAQVSNVSYVVLPPRSDEGLHKPPYPMFFILLSGLAHVTIAESDDELTIMEGVNGLMIAADVVGDGHYTAYPSDKETHALQVPFRDSRLPDHHVLHPGVCKGNVALGNAASMKMVEQQQDVKAI